MIKKLTPETDALDCELHTPRVLQDRYSEMRDHAQKLERERDEAQIECLEQARLLGMSSEREAKLISERDKAREELKHITEYGTEEINAAVELRQKLASTLVERDEANSELNEKYIEYDQLFEEAEKIRIERDEARERCSKLEKAMSYSSGATTLLSRFLKVLNERNGLIQKLDAWEEIAEHLHHLVQHPAYGVDQAIRRMDVLEAYKHLKNGH